MYYCALKVKNKISLKAVQLLLKKSIKTISSQKYASKDNNNNISANGIRMFKDVVSLYVVSQHKMS